MFAPLLRGICVFAPLSIGLRRIDRAICVRGDPPGLDGLAHRRIGHPSVARIGPN